MLYITVYTSIPAPLLLLASGFCSVIVSPRVCRRILLNKWIQVQEFVYILCSLLFRFRGRSRNSRQELSSGRGWGCEGVAGLMVEWRNIKAWNPLSNWGSNAPSHESSRLRMRLPIRKSPRGVNTARNQIALAWEMIWKECCHHKALIDPRLWHQHQG